jgi:hypothetical protein
MTSKTCLRFFLWCFNLLKPYYVYTTWLHKISPNLIVCKICSVNSIRNPRNGVADNRSKNNIHQNLCLLHRVCIFQLYLEFVWRNSIFLVKSLLIYDSRSILKCSHGTLIVCRICSINSIRNLRHGCADNRSKNNIYQNQASRGTNAVHILCQKL